MKYIKTKDGRIIDTTKGEYIINGDHLILYRQYETVSGVKVKPGQMCVPSVAIMEEHVEYNFIGFIEKIAETIEELCDEFVFKRENERNINTADLFYVKNELRFENNVEYIYGAIWTDKGLIYVAKMNNEGELELL